MNKIFNFIIFYISILFLVNMFSNHLFFFNSVGNLLIIIILLIISLFTFYISSLKSNFLIIKKNEIYKQYYLKLLKLYYIFYLYKNIIFQNILISTFQNYYFKFIILFYNINLNILLNSISNLYSYLYNNFLNTFYINNYFIFSIKFKLLNQINYKNFIFKKYFTIKK